MRFLPLTILMLALAAPVSEAKVAPVAVPSRPTYYVLDEPRVIPSKPLKSLETLLIEHDRLTGEQIMVAVVSGTRGEELPAYAQRIFEQWRVGMRGEGSGVLLVLDWSSRKATVRTGLGMDGTLPEARWKKILKDFLLPEARSGDAARGLSLASLEILRALDSPLVQSGQARQILLAGGFTGPWRAVGGTGLGAWWALWILMGLAPLGVALFQVTSAEAHFTSTGWFRPNPVDQLRSATAALLERVLRRGPARSSLEGRHGASAQW